MKTIIEVSFEIDRKMTPKEQDEAAERLRQTVTRVALENLQFAVGAIPQFGGWGSPQPDNEQKTTKVERRDIVIRTAEDHEV